MERKMERRTDRAVHHSGHELSDAEWAVLQPLLPPLVTGGRRYRDHRGVLDAMLFHLTTRTPWRELPARYGPWQTVHSRYKRWCRCGLWVRMLQVLQSGAVLPGGTDWSRWRADASQVCPPQDGCHDDGPHLQRHPTGAAAQSGQAAH